MGSRYFRRVFAGTVLVCLAAGPAVPTAVAQPIDVDRLAGIYYRAPLTYPEEQAVQQLKLGMKQLYGSQLRDLPNLKSAGRDQSVIILGRRTAVAAGATSDQELARITLGGYLIKCGDGRIVIAGDDGWATYYGVVGFLEKLSMRFFLPDPAQAYVPKPASRLIQPFALFDRPTFTFRNGWHLLFRECHPVLGDPRKGLNPELFDPKRTGSDLWIDHSAGYLVPKVLFYDRHPEYYAMGKDGKRLAKESFSDHRTPLCLWNPDVTRISIERALAWIGKNPDQRFFSVTYGDTGSWCQCPECLKLDPAPAEYATRLLHWVNPVARAVGQKYPDKIVLTFAYGGTDQPPPVARPEKNVWMVVATGSGCYPFWDHSFALDGADTRKITAWTGIAPRKSWFANTWAITNPRWWTS